jgi:hypothetical protein
VRDLRALVRYAYTLTGMDPAYPPRGSTLVALLMGPGGIRYARTGELPAGCPAKLQRARQRRPDGQLPDSGHWEIIVRGKLTPRQHDECCCHEAGELLCKQIRYREDDRERFSNEVGWALQGPDEVVKRLFIRHGFDLAAIGEELGLSDLAVAVRIAQACPFPTMMSTPDGFATVGESIWPTDDTLAVHQGLFAGVLPDNIVLIKLASVPDHCVIFALPELLTCLSYQATLGASFQDFLRSQCDGGCPSIRHFFCNKINFELVGHRAQSIKLETFL